MIISLGFACKVRSAIQSHTMKNSMETNMFDWLFSNFDSILYFLGNIDKALTEEDFFDTNQKCFEHRMVNHCSIRFDTLHDVIFDNAYETEIIKLLDKYNRRLKRLKDTILSAKTIDFIHLVDCEYNYRLPNKNIYIPTLEEVSKFHELIKAINPNCVYNLHILIPPHGCKIYNTIWDYDKTQIDRLASNNVFIYFLTQRDDIEPAGANCLHWSWSDVFKNISDE